MVYGGKPSRGCQTCRQRRIKCDERKPSCVQCEKSNRVCQGYRDVLDLLFKSENEGVERRVGRNSPEQIYYVLPQEPEQLALNYFFKHYIFIPRKSEAARGYLEVLPVLYADVAPTSSLLSATSALAFTTFARDAFGKQFLPNARLKYGEAIHRINEALRDPVAVRKDETLMAVLIMGMVEMSTSATTLFWNTHTDGAAAIIKLRGREIFARETSMRLFHHTRIQMALRRVQAPPGTLKRMDADDFMETLESDIPPDFERSVTNTLTKLTLRVPKIRLLADNLLREKRSESTTQAILQLIECCRHLDTALLTWCEMTPDDWKYTSQPNFISVRGEFDPETSEFYPVNVDVYPDIWIAKVWNSYRTSRTVVQAIILRAVAWLAGGDMRDSRVISQMAVALQARRIAQEMVDEICASVPFNLGYATTASKERASTVADKSYSQVPKGQEDPTEHLGGYFLLWPLYLAGSARIIPNEQKRWINVRLLRIARSLALDEELVTTKLHEPPGQVLFGAPLTYTPYNIA